MPKKSCIKTDQAPNPVGAYSQGIIYGDLIFTAQIGLDPKTEKFPGDDIRSQTQQTLENISAILAAGGATMGGVLKVTVFLQDLDDFDAMNEVYARFFPGDPPARATVEAPRLPLGARVEIECIAGR